MSAFQFRTVPHLIVEGGAAAQLGAHIAHHFPSVRRALLVTDAGFLRTGLAAAPLHSLQAAGIEVHVFAEVQADPPEAIVLAGVAQAQMFHVELIIGLGGGSSLDVAKLIAVLAPGRQALAQLYGIGNVQGQRLPLVQLPTTAGTGSEVTHIAIVTTGATTKMGVVAPQLYADLAILDASLTLGLPPAVTAATGIDAMVHAIEAYTSRLLKNPLSDMLATQALSLLSSNLLTACRDGSNLPARQAMLLGAMLAGQAFANAPVAAMALRLAMVSSSDSPLDADDREISRLITSADRRVAAISNVVRVRVEFSKNRLNTLLPRSNGTFLTSRSLTPTKFPAVSRMCVRMALGKPSIDSRWISSPFLLSWGFRRYNTLEVSWKPLGN